MNSRASTAILILVIVLLLAGAYMFFLPPDSVTALSTDAGADKAEQQFISLAGALDPISFDTSIFSDPRFGALIDIRTQVVPEAAGRTDPFAPLAGSAQ